MQLYVARHGETTWNKEKRILGSTPGALTEQGKRQAELLAEHIKSLDITLVLASDLLRIKDTCVPIQKHYPTIPVQFTPHLRERNFGAWEGKLRKEVDWQGIWEGSSYEPALSRQIGAEPLSDFRLRLAKFITDFHATYADTPMNVLFVTSIGVQNTLRFLTDPDHFTFYDFPNAEAIQFDVTAMAQNAQKLLAR